VSFDTYISVVWMCAVGVVCWC